MAFAPVIGAVAGAAGTVAQMSQASSSARNQRAQLTEQRRQMTQQYQALQTQRQFQRDIASAEMGRLRQQIASAEAVQLFNTELERRSIDQAEILNQAQAASELFQINQQQAVEMTQAAQQREQESQGMQEASQQMEQGVQQAIGEDERAVTAAARGQSESRTTDAQGLAQAQQLDDAYQRFNELFQMNMAVAEQNQGISNRLTELQTALGTNEAETRDLMARQDLAIATTQNERSRDFIAIDTAMNQAAADAELAARLFNIEAAEHSDSMAYQGALTTNRMTQAQTQGPGLFGMLPGLLGAGMNIYNAVTPLKSPTARVTNPMYSPSSAPSRPLDYSTGVMTDRTNSLFNIG